MKQRNQKLLSKIIIPLLVMGQVSRLIAMPQTAKMETIEAAKRIVREVEVAQSEEVHKLTQEDIIKAEASDVLTWGGVTQEPILAVDGDNNTYWQTSDFALGAENDGTKSVDFIVELKNSEYISQLEILARQDHTNGGIKDYQLYLGNDKDNLTKVKEGTLGSVAQANSPAQQIVLESPVEAKFIKLVVTKGVANNVAIAELGIYTKAISPSQDTTIQSASYTLEGKSTEIEIVPGKINYAVTLPKGTTAVPILEVAANDPNGEVAITQAVDSNGEAIVTVANGEEVQTYTFDFIVQVASSDATLTSIKYNGRDIKNFSQTNTNYDIILPFGTTGVEIQAVATHKEATVEIGKPEQLPGVGTVVVTAEDGTKNTYTMNFTVAQADGGHLASYMPNFDEMTTKDLNWESWQGNPVYTIEEGQLKVETSGVSVGVDKNSPKITNGEITTDLTVTKGNGRFGFVVRAVDKNNYSAICYDAGNWVWIDYTEGKETYGTLFSYPLKNDVKYNIRIRFKDNELKVYIDEERVYSGSSGGVGVREGYIGTRTWFDSKTMYIDNFKVKEIEDKVQPSRPEDAKWLNISSGDTTVVVDSTFPAIQKYTIGGVEAFKGQVEYASGVSINGEVMYPTKVDYTRISDSKVEYKLYLEGEVDEKPFAGIITAIVEVIKDEDGDSIVTFEVTQMDETSETKINSIQFPGQSLITVEGGQSGYGVIKCTGGWHGISEEIVSLGDIVKGKNSGTYGFLYNETYSAAIDNNVMDSGSKLSINHQVSGDSKSASFSSGAFTYRAVDEEVAIAGGLGATEALPKAQVVISGDNNADEVLDWQDGAVAIRKIIKEPKGSDRMRESMSYIAMNFISNAASPFLRVLDNAKVLSHYTDGFGQNILNKGYQAEGHDDSFPSFANVGIRQGGAKDFNVLGDSGEDYNVDTGVHVNINEYMLDSMDIRMENMHGELGSLSAGWGWLDQAYYVDQQADLITGEIERRFDELDEAVPTLDFLYVDVYAGAGWHAKEVAEIINDNDWYLATEFGGPFEGDQVWTHWGTDLYYPTTDTSSDMYRFIFNHQKDMFATDTLLKGSQMPGMSAWQNRTNMFEGVEVFYNQNLPSKYMQHFPIIKMTEDRVDFKQGVYVQKEGDRVRLYGKDGQLVADMTDAATRCQSTLFVPWNPITEEKIYHWNNDGGVTTWELPSSWDGLDEVHVYETTSTGRIYVGTVPVKDSQVTMVADKQVGYIVTKSQDETNGLPEETVWGEGSEIKDPGFNSMNFEKSWTKSSTTGQTDHIQMIRDDKFNNELQISGKEDGVVEQTITGLKPGQSYTISAWINATRPTTLGTTIDGKVYEATIENNKILNGIESHKYTRTNYQRISLDITVPQNVTTAGVYFYAPEVETEGLTKIDDVRIVELPGHTNRNEEGAIYFEDFENVDEGWGPFEYTGGPGQTHLAYKDEEGKQIIDYVIDGNWSLKSNETDKTGEIFRTYPSKIAFDTNKTYKVTMDYSIFKDKHGLFKVSEQDVLTASIKDGKGNVVATQKLTNSTIDEAVNKASINQIQMEFNTTQIPDTKDMYLCIEAIGGAVKDILIVDNFKLELVEDHDVVTISDVKLNNGRVEIVFKDAVGEITEADVKVALDRNGKIEPITFTSFSYDEVTQKAVGTFDAISYAEHFQRVQAIVEYNGYQAVSNPIIIKEETDISEPFNMTLSGVEEVKSGEEFTVIVGINNADKPIYATDFEVKYDSDLFSLGEITALTPTEIIEKLHVDEESIRVLTFTEGGAMGALQQLAMNFTAKEIKGTQKGEIAINGASIGVVVDEVSSSIEGLSTEKTVAVKGEETEPTVPEDINEDKKIDVADLALIAYYYQTEAEDDNWEQAKKADVNGDKKIDILDLVEVAKKILE